MNWTAQQAAIKAAVVAALGVSASQVRWQHEADAATWAPFPSVLLSLRNPRGLGIDQVRYDYDAQAEALIPTYEGPREVTVEIKIESDSQVPGADAVGQLSSQLRTRLRWHRIRAELDTAELGLSTIGQTVQADYRSDGRMVSAAVTEVLLLAAETESDTVSSGIYFDTVEVESETLNGPDGEPLPEQENLTIPEE